jgi:glycosyltransferase involved in cell wall biosynthesis
MRTGNLVGAQVAARPRVARIPLVRVQLVDPSADVLPYDHALAAALARQGAAVELATSRFVHGPAPAPDGYGVSESFYPLATRLGAQRPRLRRLLKGAEHVPGLLGVRRRPADLTHWQWMWLESLSLPLLARDRPQVLTMHNVIRRDRSARRLIEAMDAVIVHTRRGAELLGGAPQVHVIPHGAFEHLTRQAGERPLPPELAAVEGPVVLCFGVVRPYKGVDVLLDAFRSIEGAELWVVGRPLGVTLEPAPGVRLLPRYVSDAELPAFFRRADLLVLPHHNVDVSGVLFAGLAFGKPMLLSDVGGFREVVEDHGAGRLVPPGDAAALATAIRELLDDPAERERLAERARATAAGPYSWDSIGARTLAVYREVLAA